MQDVGSTQLPLGMGDSDVGIVFAALKQLSIESSAGPLNTDSHTSPHLLHFGLCRRLLTPKCEESGRSSGSNGRLGAKALASLNPCPDQ